MTTRIPIELPADQAAQLAELAARDGTTAEAVLRELVQAFLADACENEAWDAAPIAEAELRQRIPVAELEPCCTSGRIGALMANAACKGSA